MEDSSRIRIINDQAIEIAEEDHTLMNVMKWVLSNNFIGEEIEFCGYTIPHPSDNVAHLTVQFLNEEKQQPQNVLDAVKDSLECINSIGKKLLDAADRAECEWLVEHNITE